MSLLDFSFNNTQIRSYFEGSDVYVPTSELLYLHSHPLIRPNFLDQLEAMILKATEVIKRKNIRGAVISRLTEHTKNFGAELPDITQKNAPTILHHLREIYTICSELLINNNIMNS